MKLLLYLTAILCLFAFQYCNPVVSAYYVDGIKGNDNNPGTVSKPLKTIEELNRRVKNSSRSVFFAGGQKHTGTLILSGIKGTELLVIDSYGPGRAMINSGNNEAVHIENCKNIVIRNIDLLGSGRKDGSATNGLSFSESVNCVAEDLTVSGFQKSGVDLYNCRESKVSKVFASGNGFSGINVMGSSRKLSGNIKIIGCRAENNPGDPTNLSNHSGNGILVGVSDSVLIDHCSATNNGWDMPRQGNGPVGIWAWESDHVLIQYCISYRNKTSPHAKDGGGFDLDGGVTNSLIQYCLSYDNFGAGYGLFQYYGASFWTNNVIRYCVSINDGQTTEGSGGIFIWNGSGDGNQLTNCLIYNNVIYNTKAPLLSYEASSNHKNFTFSNNIFIGSDHPLAGLNTGSTFNGNDWWNETGDLRFMGYSSLAEWSMKTGQEMNNGHFSEMQLDPRFNGPTLTSITDPWQLDKLSGYSLQPDSPLKNTGISINVTVGFESALKDFFGNQVPMGKGAEPGIFEMK